MQAVCPNVDASRELINRDEVCFAGLSDIHGRLERHGHRWRERGRKVSTAASTTNDLIRAVAISDTLLVVEWNQTVNLEGFQLAMAGVQHCEVPYQQPSP